jgi:hypothetical protein
MINLLEGGKVGSSPPNAKERDGEDKEVYWQCIAKDSINNAFARRMCEDILLLP